MGLNYLENGGGSSVNGRYATSLPFALRSLDQTPRSYQRLSSKAWNLADNLATTRLSRYLQSGEYVLSNDEIEPLTRLCVQMQQVEHPRSRHQKPKIETANFLLINRLMGVHSIGVPAWTGIERPDSESRDMIAATSNTLRTILSMICQLPPNPLSLEAEPIELSDMKRYGVTIEMIQYAQEIHSKPKLHEALIKEYRTSR